MLKLFVVDKVTNEAESEFCKDEQELLQKLKSTYAFTHKQCLKLLKNGWVFIDNCEYIVAKSQS